MFTVFSHGDRSDFDDITDVVSMAAAEDQVYVPTRGWMLVGDLKLDMIPGWADIRPTLRLPQR